MTLRQEHRLLTKRRLLGAALEVFAQRGYNAATVEDMCCGRRSRQGQLLPPFQEQDGTRSVSHR